MPLVAEELSFLPEHLSSQEEFDGKTPQGKTRQKTNNHLKKYTQQTWDRTTWIPPKTEAELSCSCSTVDTGRVTHNRIFVSFPLLNFQSSLWYFVYHCFPYCTFCFGHCTVRLSYYLNVVARLFISLLNIVILEI